MMACATQLTHVRLVHVWACEEDVLASDIPMAYAMAVKVGQHISHLLQPGLYTVHKHTFKACKAHWCAVLGGCLQACIL